MKSSSPAWSFCWKLVVIYLVLVAPGPWIKEWWAGAFRETVTSLFQPIPAMTIKSLAALGCKATVNELRPEDLSVRFDPIKKPDRVLDSDMLIIRENAAYRGQLVTLAGRMSVSGWHKCYIPIATIIAMVLATPVSWRRRIVALLWGIPLVVFFILLGLTLTFINGISAGDPLALFELSATAKKVITEADHVISRAPVTSFLFPVFIWLLVMFQHVNWGEVFGTATAPDSGRARRSG